MVSVCACVFDVRKRRSMLPPIVDGNNPFQVHNLCNFSVGEKSAVPYPGEDLCERRRGCVCVRACAGVHVHLYMYCTMCVKLTSLRRINPSPRFYGNTLCLQNGCDSGFQGSGGVHT